MNNRLGEPQIESQLKSAVYLSVSRIVEEEISSLDGNVSATPTFVAALVDLVYNQLINLGEDLESFARHAGRTTIDPSDMYMVTRKNSSLMEALKAYEKSKN
ncbi:Piso0_001531 [Millerozyma farinosa CBS 7064]|uniref:Piso0_001531 protein n=1 Tax=Pichia sorbitophila (strain ATCC MYA-4447 / BCRC 22081 / CBS 7064 / NBRC 10061 / NRRL Y-12695) TaxID=559304 RepID=G8YL18_PICSO|nr:Piso0_001531 [Millerozyma farinosa CBS 7064]